MFFQAGFFFFYTFSQFGKPEHIAPVAENKGLADNIINRAVLGGYTAGDFTILTITSDYTSYSCLVHTRGRIGGPDFVINNHLNGLQSRPQHPFWRNYTELEPDPVFDRMASTVHTYDIVSQYATAASKPLPVGPSVCYHAFNEQVVPKLSRKNLVNLSSYCRANRVADPDQRIVFKKIHARDRVFVQEHHAVRRFFRQVLADNPGITVLRVASATHAGNNHLYLPVPFPHFSLVLGGQLRLGQFSFDGAIAYLTSGGEHRLEIVNFHAAFTHGCEDDCTNPNPLYADRVQASRKTDERVRLFLNYLAKELEINITFRILSDCPSHKADPLSEADKKEALLSGPTQLSYAGQ